MNNINLLLLQTIFWFSICPVQNSFKASKPIHINSSFSYKAKSSFSNKEHKKVETNKIIFVLTIY